MQKMVRLFLLIAFTCLGTYAWADVETTWTLNNAVFTDGGTATGSFVFDNTTGDILSYDISVSGGATTTFPAFVYQNGTPDNTGAFNDGPPFGYMYFRTDIEWEGNPLALRGIALPTYPLPASGGTVPFDLSNIFQGECYDCTPFRAFSSGDVTAPAGVITPEPGTVTLLGCGLLGLAGMARRKIGKNA